MSMVSTRSRLVEMPVVPDQDPDNGFARVRLRKAEALKHQISKSYPPPHGKIWHTSSMHSLQSSLVQLRFISLPKADEFDTADIRFATVVANGDPPFQDLERLGWVCRLTSRVTTRHNALAQLLFACPAWSTVSPVISDAEIVMRGVAAVVRFTNRGLALPIILALLGS